MSARAKELRQIFAHRHCECCQKRYEAISR